jgi:hypothetical protein
LKRISAAPFLRLLEPHQRLNQRLARLAASAVVWSASKEAM